MKAVIILLLLVSANIFAIDIIDFDASIEIGLIPQGHIKIYELERDVYKELSFYGDFIFTTRMFDRHLFYGVGSKIYMWKVVKDIAFKPDQINFLFFAGVTINDYTEIGFRHYCNHPLKAWEQGSEITNIEKLQTYLPAL